jgi:hypothetical protein
MLRRKRLFLFLGAVSVLAAFFVMSAWGAPDPTTNKNAVLVDLDCGGYQVTASGIFRAIHQRSLSFPRSCRVSSQGAPRQHSATTLGTTLLGQASRSRRFANRASSVPTDSS